MDSKTAMTPSEVLKAFRDGELELFCPSMEVRQEASDSPVVHAGSGMIRQTPDRRLHFKLVTTETASDQARLARMLSGNHYELGKLIPADAYYSFVATDLFAWTWTSQRIHIDQTRGPGGSCVSGDLPMLEHTEPSKRDVNGLTLSLRGDVEIPCNTGTETRTLVAERELRSATRNAAKFDVGPYSFLLEKDSDGLTVSVDSEREGMPPQIETRVVESLQFVTARTLGWTLMQKQTGGSCTTCLRSSQTERPTKLSPPVDYRQRDFAGSSVWPLFGNYLQHVLKFSTEKAHEMHPVSAWLNFVRDASSGSVFAKGLGLAIAVEGVLAAEFPAAGEPTADVASAIRDAVGFLDTWDGNACVKTRALAALRAMLRPRVKDSLLSLVADGSIRRDDFNAWDAIRNRAAHAAPPESEERQKWLDNCFKAEVLLYHLIFRAIGYEGQFTDYGADGWPQVDYPIAQAAREKHHQG